MGAFFVVFLVVPADLAGRGSVETFYTVGTLLPLMILGFLSLISSQGYFAGFSYSSIPLVLSLILFLSVILVLKAKETLSESVIFENKIKEHLNEVEKLVQESNEEKKGAESSQ